MRENIRSDAWERAARSAAEQLRAVSGVRWPIVCGPHAVFPLGLCALDAADLAAIDLRPVNDNEATT